MLTFVLRRLSSGLLMLFVLSSIAFFMLYLSGGDIARSILGDFATQDAVDRRAAELGLDQPILNRYVEWVGNAIRGDFGTSWFGATEVNSLLAQRVTVTLSLVAVSIVLIAVVATVVGVAAAVHRGGWLDRAIQTFSLIFAAIPNFLTALVFVVIFALQLRWFPPTGFTDPSTSVTGWLVSITIPVAALLVAGFASATQQVRSAMINVLNQDYVRTLRSAGLSRRSILFKHALRNAAGPGLTVLSVQFVGLLGGAIVIENLFAIPGLGALSARSTIQGDIPVVMGIVVLVASIVIVVNLVIDIAQGWLNPKVRVS